MISQSDMLGIIATEAIESYSQTYEAKAKRRSEKQPKPIRIGLRLVREKDGTLRWKD